MIRDNGFAPIRSYAALGDGRTVALVAEDGSIDWLAAPTLDSPPVFAALLDPPDGGCFSLQPVEEFQVLRGYLGDANVLATTFRTATGSVRVTDALTTGTAGRLPWLELARRIEGMEGEVHMRWAVAPGTRFGTTRPWTRARDEAHLLHVGDQHLAVRCFDVGTPRREPQHFEGEFFATTGSRGLLALIGVDSEPVFLPSRDHIEDRLDRTIDDWLRWSDQVAYDGPWCEQVRRSALALKTLLYAPSGAIAAAPTTSLPEVLGGDRNYDYRYAWVRDASFTLDAMIRLGLAEEVHAAVSWLLGCLIKSSPDIHVFYKLDGGLDDRERELDAPGYRCSRPVRAGNSAARQTQLGTFGDLFDMVWRYVREGHVIDSATERLLVRLADRCCDTWRQEDAGIWELDELRHYTISKIGCWTALDRALAMCEVGEIRSKSESRWRAERDAIRVWVEKHCWSSRLGAYTFYAGSDELDAAVLLAGRTNFDTGPRLASTIDAICTELGRGPLLYRYTGMIGKEGAFVACSFWLVDALVRVGRLDDARDLMDELLKLTNDVGLLAEEMDPDDHSFLGNFPQGLSHLALINAAATYAEAQRR
ncbi:MAG: glycoside hydrolase family 15 protein [Actinomycetes bacterium]